MNGVQRIIKYSAIVIAFLLIISIFNGLINFISIFSNNLNKAEESSFEYKNIDINDNMSVLDIELKSSNLIIQEGEYLNISTNDPNIEVRQNNNRTFITQKSINNKKNSDKVIVYVPNGLEFDNVNIVAGLGNVEINKLATKKLDFELGAGKVSIKDMFVFNETDIEGGAGELKIVNSRMNNLDLDLGIGSVTIEAYIFGKSDIDAGVGEVNLNLIGNSNIYKMNIERGIGNIIIDGQNIKNNGTYGNGNNIINIEGGIGNIKVNFFNNNF